jgi:hypothetical protein
VLPLPPGAAGALVARDVAACAGGWFVVGAVRGADGATRPAVWASADGAVWRAARPEPITFYGEQNVLSAVACRADGRAAAVGAKTGGVHGNPRTSSWVSAGAGRWREVAGTFELFGGADAVNVGRLAAGPAGFLIAGNRVTGAAVWVSRDASGFELRSGVPGLATDGAGSTWADDAVALDGGWLVVGGVRPRGRTDRDALGWRSADGVVWSRVPAEGVSGAYEEMQRVVTLRGVPVGVGVSGSSFGVWRLDGARWRPVGSFGVVRRAGVSAVRSLAVVGDRLFVVTSDGAAYGVWVSPDGGASWSEVVSPVGSVVGPESSVTVAGVGSRVVLVVDDGSGARLFSAE